jgi:DNA repair protein RadA/Sms
MGEVGLTGEIRNVSQMEKRIAECAKMGFKKCIIPKDHLKQLKPPKDMELIGVSHVSEALGYLLS